MFGLVAGKAKLLSESLSEKVVSVKGAALSSVAGGASVATEYVEKHWPQIERLLVDGMLTIAHERIADDESFSLVAEKAFELLPTPVRLLLPRSAFLAHSEKHRASIIQLIEGKRRERLALESQP
ncbi:hypothetical protein NRY95_17980 [Xanthomonas campestris pv. phormiicola]|nr:hypothetical protein [Xanthomonas campestris pv. phormiicola]UYC15572.1 hypothetical protein NRY95_17980 [Xanthomonas campestris pv. phormiicola]